MTQSPVSDPMTAEAFLAWAPTQPERYELVDGVPVLMTGARVKHDRVLGALFFRLYGATRGTHCETFTDDIGVRTSPTSIFRPDLLIDCGKPEGDAMIAAEPVAVIEVLSPSTSLFDSMRKSIAYKSVASIKAILLVDPDAPRAILIERAKGDIWREDLLVGADAEIRLPRVEVTLRLGDLYA
ncbi:MAG: Uma2 family endonuclease [Hyphomicrobiaceae bacterium]|nr:Uma2 family endonuclease [Hyphomicrobiaceae bacterium]